MSTEKQPKITKVFAEWALIENIPVENVLLTINQEGKIVSIEPNAQDKIRDIEFPVIIPCGKYNKPNRQELIDILYNTITNNNYTLTLSDEKIKKIITNYLEEKLGQEEQTQSDKQQEVFEDIHKYLYLKALQRGEVTTNNPYNNIAEDQETTFTVLTDQPKLNYTQGKTIILLYPKDVLHVIKQGKPELVNRQLIASPEKRQNIIDKDTTIQTNGNTKLTELISGEFEYFLKNLKAKITKQEEKKRKPTDENIDANNVNITATKRTKREALKSTIPNGTGKQAA